MKIDRYAQVIAIILIFGNMAITDARKCRKSDSQAGRCVRLRERREKKSKKAAPPHWKKGPPKEDQVVVREGSDITLNCAVTGSPKPDLAWLINGKQLDAKKSDKHRQRKTKLDISSVQITDSSSYTCIAKNRHGSLNFTYFIRVLENMPLNDIDVVEKPENQTAHIGDTVMFMCRSPDWPKPNVHWTRKLDINNFQESVNNGNSDPMVLLLRNVQREEAGIYTCIIGNSKITKELSAVLKVIGEGESLPFEPLCSLHMRQELLIDYVHGCKAEKPVDVHYCMGSCGRSYYVPRLVTSKTEVLNGVHLNQTCKCCIGIVDSLRLIELQCPLGQIKTGFYTLLRGCECKPCVVKRGPMMDIEDDDVEEAEDSH